jgi:hypothetical protein
LVGSAEPARNDHAPTFNVIFTPGSVTRLLPFALSLLRSPTIRLRLVANGCDPHEVELIHSVATTDSRVSDHVVHSRRPIEHGLALNELFETYPEPYFAFTDSDVIADGDFMASLGTPGPRQAGVFTAPPVWLTDEDRTAGALDRLGGRRSRLPDGTYVGNTYCAVYRRGTLESVWDSTPMGFAGVPGHRLPDDIEAQLDIPGWTLRWVDTGRVLNLKLLAAGFKLGEREVPQLHHVGGLSHPDDVKRTAPIRRFSKVVRAAPKGSRLRFVAADIRAHLRRRMMGPYRRHPWLVSRRAVVRVHVDRAIDAIRDGKSVPPAPRTGSGEVDRRLADLLAALETGYPPGLAVVRDAGRTGGPEAMAR